MAGLVVNGGAVKGFPWAEFISSKGSTMDLIFGYGDNSATLSIRIPWEFLADAVRALLGTNRRNPESGLLERQLPARHPTCPQFWCEKIVHVKPLKFRGKVPGPVGWTSHYQEAIVTARFARPKWENMLSDQQLALLHAGKEQYRFVTKRQRPTSESLSIKPDTLIYSEGAGGTAPTANDTKVETMQSQLLARIDWTWTWHRVPLSKALLSHTNELPVNLLDGLYKTNASEWCGCPAGTLLLRGYDIRPIENPDFDALLQEKAGVTPLLGDVDLAFSYFNPPVGGTARGWATLPYKDGLFYGVRFTVPAPPAAPRRLLGEYDFDLLFQLPG